MGRANLVPRHRKRHDGKSLHPRALRNRQAGARFLHGYQLVAHQRLLQRRVRYRSRGTVHILIANSALHRLIAKRTGKLEFAKVPRASRFKIKHVAIPARLRANISSLSRHAGIVTLQKMNFVKIVMLYRAIVVLRDRIKQHSLSLPPRD